MCLGPASCQPRGLAKAQPYTHTLSCHSVYNPHWSGKLKSSNSVLLGEALGETSGTWGHFRALRTAAVGESCPAGLVWILFIFSFWLRWTLEP